MFKHKNQLCLLNFFKFNLKTKSKRFTRRTDNYKALFFVENVLLLEFGNVISRYQIRVFQYILKYFVGSLKRQK